MIQLTDNSTRILCSLMLDCARIIERQDGVSIRDFNKARRLRVEMHKLERKLKKEDKR